ncbi:hypothetical protein ACFQ60_22490 [Streptomyces zhihengii]|uniref:Uncharacterized protein n=1 Tax=Streptomyces zhihengii TaxID=1818004 RepID=A0ABS2UVY2_9ACTN|nr:hypothetical protein [Streptomyces zhihengii]MBM9621012.1 hypothetical protein [Streptomyces zhihengii]
MTTTPTEPCATVPPEVAHRRATVRHLAQQGLSNRAISARLGLSKDMVRRDLAAPAPPTETRAQRLARRAKDTDEAMRQLCAAAQAVDGADPAHTPTDDETARRWYDDLRATAVVLLAHAEAFADYYPRAMIGVQRRTEDVSAP